MVHHKGDIVYMDEAALENYGDKWRNVPLTVTHVAYRYMAPGEFYRRGMPDGYHPGYDGATGSTLYDLQNRRTGEDVPFSLYDWELR